MGQGGLLGIIGIILLVTLIYNLAKRKAEGPPFTAGDTVRYGCGFIFVILVIPVWIILELLD